MSLQKFMNGRVILTDAGLDYIKFVGKNLSAECLLDMKSVIDEGIDIYEFCRLVHNHASVCKTLFYGEPVMVCGIAQAYPDRTDVGYFFMFFTEKMKMYPITLLKHTREVFFNMTRNCGYPLVVSTVHPDNVKSLKWARSLGATICDPVETGAYYTCEWRIS